ncbi:hypothetical protein D3C76_1632390 [compost metagenome]
MILAVQSFRYGAKTFVADRLAAGEADSVASILHGLKRTFDTGKHEFVLFD